LDVGFIAHPSLVEAEELKAIQKPLSVAAAGKLDGTFVCVYAGLVLMDCRQRSRLSASDEA
jgi:hypothetical protein